MEVSVHWSLGSLILYLSASWVGWLCATRGNKSSKKQKLFYYLIWYTSWLILAVFRLVQSNGVGGTDARGYTFYFEDCLNPNTASIFSYRAEPLFRLFNKLLRHITGDYRIYFLIVYTIIIISIIYFVNENLNEYTSSIMLMIMFYMYLISFSIIRSGLSIALYLIGIVLLEKNKYVKSSVFITIAVLIHTATIVYSGFFVFYLIYKKSRKPKVLHALFYSITGYILAVIIQRLTLNGTISFNIGQPVDVYVSLSLSHGFFKDYWKIVITQLLLLIFICTFKNKIDKYLNNIKDLRIHKNFYYIYLLCIYDLIVIPITFVLNLWRGVDYLFLPRLIMWGYIIKTIQEMVIEQNRHFVKYTFGFIGVCYMIFRICNNFKMAGLMPYVFEPLYRLLN